ncbi:uncharacterized protein J8A68_005886 [[Candida] subhashii]|uniref:Uncharacterized protein n=1 Tax=[Candida] subhashii TaxID=561895 RepID=A0A8J5USF5_9ASCO|nr:uncharacterized protein J8A68_005886 [[Candida] subhashii]KAG7660620.1 hypothetical protein J8A68_005886 [[Candida] subhashii]
MSKKTRTSISARTDHINEVSKQPRSPPMSSTLSFYNTNSKRQQQKNYLPVARISTNSITSTTNISIKSTKNEPIAAQVQTDVSSFHQFQLITDEEYKIRLDKWYSSPNWIIDEQQERLEFIKNFKF